MRRTDSPARAWAHRLGVQRALRTAREHLRTLRRLMATPPPLHRSEGLLPFFIVGSGRCGTTLLRRILQGSPAVHIPPESYQLRQTILRFRRYRRLMDWEDLAQLLAGHMVRDGEYPAAFYAQLRTIQEGLLQVPRTERSLAALLDRLYRGHGRAVGATFERWGDKSPVNVFSMDEIQGVFPDAQFVCLLRDGVDVVHSFLRTGIIGRLEEAAQWWGVANRYLFRFMDRHPAACHLLRYEDLVTHPHDELSGLSRFLGIDDVAVHADAPRRELDDLMAYDHHHRALASITMERIGAGRRSLSAEHLRRLGMLIGPQLERYGYASCP